METLNVFLLGKLAGILESEKGTLSFRYSEDYLQDPSATPLSFTFPYTALVYVSASERAF